MKGYHIMLDEIYNYARNIPLLRELYRKAADIPIVRKIYTGWGKTIPFLVISVGQACNFKCSNCSNMAPYSPKELRRYSCEEMIRNLTAVLDEVKKIRVLQIQGGEPFLYSDLDKIIKFAGAENKVKQIDIATNGSIMPKSSLLKVIRKYNASIRISDYNVVPEKAEALYKKCIAMGIDVKYYSFVSGKSQWYYSGLHEMKRDNDDEIVKKRFWSCRFHNCLTLERNSLHYCSRAANAGMIQKFSEKKGDRCIVDGKEDFGNRLKDYLNNRHFMEACRYCHGTDPQFLCEPAEQLQQIRE